MDGQRLHAGTQHGGDSAVESSLARGESAPLLCYGILAKGCCCCCHLLALPQEVINSGVCRRLVELLL